MMEYLKQCILKDGKLKPGNVIKVDSFLNHQLDTDLFVKMGEEFKRRFADKNINKILTIEASGIGLAIIAATFFGNVPVVFAKKTKSSNIADDVYTADVYSYTHQVMNHIVVSKEFLNQDDHILIIDDFLANGEAVMGLLELCKQANASVEGVGIAIEKGFQKGGQLIREKGIQLESLAIIESIDDTSITFR